MNLRASFVTGLGLGLLSGPGIAQPEIRAIVERLQSIPTSSTKSDCDAQLAKAATANAFDLFYGSGVCSVAKQGAESSFLLLAGQIRSMPDMGMMMPVTQADAKTAIALYGFIYSYAGGLGDEEVLRNNTARSRLYWLLDHWNPAYGSTYNPGWATRRRPSATDYLAAIAETGAERRRQVEEMARLYSDDAYYALYRQERDLYASQHGPVVADSPVAKQLGDLMRRMNQRAIALGVGDAALGTPIDEVTARSPPTDVPPDSPGSDERVIDGSTDPVVKRCADGAEFNAILMNVRIARVIVTTTAKWGTVWRADLEGGQFGPERRVCSAHYDGSRPFDGPDGRLQPLSVPPEAKLRR